MSFLENIKMEPVECESHSDDGLPYVTHRGILLVCGVELEVFQLNTGQRIIEQHSLMRFFGLEDTP